MQRLCAGERHMILMYTNGYKHMVKKDDWNYTGVCSHCGRHAKIVEVFMGNSQNTDEIRCPCGIVEGKG